MIALAEQGVRSSVVRLPTVHSLGNYGFISPLIEIARATGVAGYLGDGSNRWAAADTHDVGRLYRLALETAPAGSRLHAAAEEGIALRDIATVIGRRFGVSIAPVAAESVEQHSGHLAMFVGLDNPTSSQITRDTLDWTPTWPGLISSLDQEQNFAVEATTPSGVRRSSRRRRDRLTGSGSTPDGASSSRFATHSRRDRGQGYGERRHEAWTS